MAIAHQAEILGAVHTTVASYDTSITPAAAPNGVCVIVVQTGAVTDAITSVTYGIAGDAVALTRRRFDTIAVEAGGVYIYWAGDGNTFPSGAQTVRVVHSVATSIRAAIATMTVAAGQQVAVDIDTTGTATQANPSWAMTTLTAVTQCYLGIVSGLQTMTNTPATNWTLAPTPGFEDAGTQGRGWARRAATSAANQLPGWIAATSEDFVGGSVAFKEVPAPVAPDGPVHPTVAGRITNPGREAPTIYS